MLSSLDVGTLAVLVVVVVPVLTLLMFLALFVRHRGESPEEVHCARCHTLVAVQGVERPPQSMGPQSAHSLASQRPVARSGGNTDSLLRRAPQSSPLLVYNQVQKPSLVVDPPAEDANLVHSATFQRLGMRQPTSGLSEEARTLESRVMSLQNSPPGIVTHGMETITPSPVVTQDNRRIQYQEPSLPPSKMDRVRVIQFPHMKTPSTRTPSNAAKNNRLAVGTKPSLNVLKPTKIHKADQRSDQSLLDMSHLDRTEVTAGDLEELCETSLMYREEEDHTPASVESVESSSHTLTEKSLQLVEQLVDSGQKGKFVTRQSEDNLQSSVSAVSLPAGADSYVTHQG